MKAETITVGELEKLSHEFGTVVSRVRRSGEHDAKSNLRRLLLFVQNTPLLATQVEAAPAPTVKVLDELEQAREQYACLDLPIARDEELGFLHALLTALAASELDFTDLAHRYGGKTKFQEAISELLDGTVTPYYQILNSPIEHLLIDHKATMSSRSNDGTVINVSGGTSQINLAREQARIVAQQQVRNEAVEVLRLAETLLSEVEGHRGGDVAEETLNELKDIGEAVAEQVEAPSPRKGVLKSLGASLSTLTDAVRGATGLAKAAGELKDGLDPLLSSLP